MDTQTSRDRDVTTNKAQQAKIKQLRFLFSCDVLERKERRSVETEETDGTPAVALPTLRTRSFEQFDVGRRRRQLTVGKQMQVRRRRCFFIVLCPVIQQHVFGLPGLFNSALLAPQQSPPIAHSHQPNKPLHKMTVRSITDDAHFQAELSAAGVRLVVVDFTATW